MAGAAGAGVVAAGAAFAASICFLHSAFILSSIFAGSILEQSILSGIAPPWDMAKEPTDTEARAVAQTIESSLFMRGLSGLS